MGFQLLRLIISGKLREALSLFSELFPAIAGVIILVSLAWGLGLAVLTLFEAASQFMR